MNRKKVSLKLKIPCFRMVCHKDTNIWNELGLEKFCTSIGTATLQAERELFIDNYKKQIVLKQKALR